MFSQNNSDNAVPQNPWGNLYQIHLVHTFHPDKLLKNLDSKFYMIAPVGFSDTYRIVPVPSLAELPQPPTKKPRKSKKTPAEVLSRLSSEDIWLCCCLPTVHATKVAKECLRTADRWVEVPDDDNSVVDIKLKELIFLRDLDPQERKEALANWDDLVIGRRCRTPECMERTHLVQERRGCNSSRQQCIANTRNHGTACKHNPNCIVD